MVRVRGAEQFAQLGSHAFHPGRFAPITIELVKQRHIALPEPGRTRIDNRDRFLAPHEFQGFDRLLDPVEPKIGARQGVHGELMRMRGGDEQYPGFDAEVFDCFLEITFGQCELSLGEVCPIADQERRAQ